MKRQHVEKRSAAEYYVCVTTTLSECEDSCNIQCTTQKDQGKTFSHDDGTCYEVLAGGSCASENTCAQGFKCNCDINGIECA